MSEEGIISDAEKTVGRDLLIFLCSSFALFGFYQLLLAGEKSKFVIASLLLAGLGGYLNIAANAMTNDDHKIVREHGRNALLRLFSGLLYYLIIAGMLITSYWVVGSLGYLFKI